MNCLPCFGSKETENNDQENMSGAQTKGHPSSQYPVNNTDSPSAPASQTMNQRQESSSDTDESDEVVDTSIRNFGFRELAMATKNFRRECLLGESRAGKVYTGTLQGTGQIVAVKQLDKHGTKANKEFLDEVKMLSLLHHQNLAKLIGYCADGDQRILVYEYIEMGSLSDLLHEVEKEPLDWITRMKIALGAAEALEYLHEKANPPVIYRNFKSTNVLLNENIEPRLTDYGLVKFEINSGNAMHQRIVSSVCSAPEYEQNGELTPKSDVYSFGVVLLELITGRKALDTTRPTDEQNLVIWAQPFFREPKRFPEMADPRLKGAFPEKSLNQAVGVAAMCVQDDPSVRPMISDVVAALSFLTVAPPQQPQPQSDPAPASANDQHDQTRLSSSSSSEGPEEELEAASSENDGSEGISYSDVEDYDDDVDDDYVNRRSKKTGYKEDRGGTSSSESLYNEDDYGEDESQQEEMSYRSTSKPKSIKRKVTFEKEKRSVSRNSSKGNNKSIKTRPGSSLRKKSVNRKPSENKKRIDVNDGESSDTNESNNNMSSTSSKSYDASLGSGLSQKSHNVLKGNQNRSDPYELNNKLSSTRSSKSNMHSNSRRSKTKKCENGESSDSSLSSDSSQSRRRVLTNASMKNGDVEILDGGEELNAKLLEDTYVPI